MSESQSTDGKEADLNPTASFLPGQAQDLKPGRTPLSHVQVPGYQLLGVLGRGGMGVVYKALQEKANRLVALKMILAGAHADPQEKMRFRVEAEAAAKLSHPNIVQLYEVGETPEGLPFFSLEYVSGGTLADRLKQGPLRPDEAAHCRAKALQWLDQAFKHGYPYFDDARKDPDFEAIRGDPRFEQILKFYCIPMASRERKRPEETRYLVVFLRSLTLPARPKTALDTVEQEG